MDSVHKEMDNLSRQMIQCKKDGFGCHYGAWKATQDPVEYERPPLPGDWRKCAWCGKPFRIKYNMQQKYCEAYCQKLAGDERNRKKKKGISDVLKGEITNV
ncbi:MAG: hypothetical protein J6Q53_04250 [Oscillospiraceae bacterium]|nr:hypothetical protein [Oscillospiraceae bacterium]